MWQGTSAKQCREMVDYATSRSPMVKFMIDKMDEVGAGWGRRAASGGAVRHVPLHCPIALRLHFRRVPLACATPVSPRRDAQ